MFGKENLYLELKWDWEVFLENWIIDEIDETSFINQEIFYNKWNRIYDQVNSMIFNKYTLLISLVKWLILNAKRMTIIDQNIETRDILVDQFRLIEVWI